MKKLKLTDDLSNPVESFWQKKEQDKLNTFKLEKENTRKDVDYVKTLGIWDKKFLPKIQTK